MSSVHESASLALAIEKQPVTPEASGIPMGVVLRIVRSVFGSKVRHAITSKEDPEALARELHRQVTNSPDTAGMNEEQLEAWTKEQISLRATQ